MCKEKAPAYFEANTNPSISHITGIEMNELELLLWHMSSVARSFVNFTDITAYASMARDST
jgi:hypothetical protein